jgi:hypothetical protein
MTLHGKNLLCVRGEAGLSILIERLRTIQTKRGSVEPAGFLDEKQLINVSGSQDEVGFTPRTKARYPLPAAILYARFADMPIYLFSNSPQHTALYPHSELLADDH